MTRQECLRLKVQLDKLYQFLTFRVITIGLEYGLLANVKDCPVYLGDIESTILCMEELNDLTDVFCDDNYMLVCETHLYACL